VLENQGRNRRMYFRFPSNDEIGIKVSVPSPKLGKHWAEITEGRAAEEGLG
jgi:hypothetical protein